MATTGSEFLALLSIYTYLFQTFSTGVWQRISCTPLHLIDLIFSNPSFENFLLHPELLPHDGDVSLLLEWLPSFMATQSDHIKVQVIPKILYFCFEALNHPRFPEISRSLCLSEGMRLLAGIMEDTMGDKELQDRDVDLSLKLDIIQMVDKYASTITRTATVGDPRASNVFGLRLQLDCRLLDSEMKELIKPDVYRGRVIPTIQLSELWKTIEDRSWTEDDINLIRAVLGNISYASLLDLLDSHKFESKDTERVKRFSKAVFDLQRILVTTFTRMNDIRPRIMRSILEDDNACIAVVAHLFNAKRQNLENANLDMLKTAFDVTGKSDLWRHLLRVSFTPTLSGVIQISQQILLMQRIVPNDKLRPWHRGYLLAFVGKVIRQSMQIVDILCSGRSGLLTTSDVLSQSDENGQILQRFWKTFWEILNIAFISATSWAESEDKDIMKNLLRDVLEGSSVLFDSLKTFDAALSVLSFNSSSPLKASSIQQTLLRDVATPLHNLAKWLCLNVDELRETTLNLAIRILKRFARAEVRVREETLVQYYRLAHGKKKNNMSEDQRERLLFVLSEHDVEPDTRKSVEAMAATRLAGSMAPVAPSISSLTSGKPPPTREVINLDDDDTQYLGNYLSDSELNNFMDRLERKPPASHEKSAQLKQTKLDFSKGVLKPSTSSSMVRTASAPIKQTVAPSKPHLYQGPSELAQLRAGFRTERQKIQAQVKNRRAPVAAPKTDAFGRPLDDAGKVIEPPRPPPKRVEESSSSESDSDSDAGGLFSIAKENKSPPKLRKVETRKVQLLGEPVRSRIALQARDRERRGGAPERNSRARLEPDLDFLFKTVLAWTPSHKGTFPPGTKQEDFKRVAATFTSSVKYEETFEPLLMLECWQHILQARMESLGESFDFVIENRQKVDEYVELFVTMKPTTYANVGLLDPDLVILSNRQGSDGKECFAKVQGMKKKKDSVELSLRCIPQGDMASLLVPKAHMFGVKLFRHHISGTI
jgi:senataxin